VAQQKELQANLDLRNPILPFLYRIIFDLRNIFVLNLKKREDKKKVSYLGAFASRDLSYIDISLYLHAYFFEMHNFLNKKKILLRVIETIFFVGT
jgi:hypothetical protein